MKTGPWEDYLERNHKMFYKCGECNTHTAVMKRRTVEDSDGKSYEFKVCCSVCQRSGSVHRNKNLAEKTWNALSDDYYENRIMKSGRRSDSK